MLGRIKLWGSKSMYWDFTQATKLGGASLNTDVYGEIWSLVDLALLRISTSNIFFLSIPPTTNHSFVS